MAKAPKKPTKKPAKKKYQSSIEKTVNKKLRGWGASLINRKLAKNKKKPKKK